MDDDDENLRKHKINELYDAIIRFEKGLNKEDIPSSRKIEINMIKNNYGDLFSKEIYG